MSKPKLYYFNGRGKMESIRWLLAAAGVEFDEVFLETRKQYEHLLKDGSLLFEQVPMVEVDGMKLVQTNAILNYFAAKYNLLGKDIHERALVDMYSEGAKDLIILVMKHPFLSAAEKDNNLTQMEAKAKSRYFPTFEKSINQQTGYMVGDQLTLADLQVLEVILMLEEKLPLILTDFPQLKRKHPDLKNQSRTSNAGRTQQAIQHLWEKKFKEKISKLPRIQKFLQPGSPKKPPPDDHYVKIVKEVLQF